MSQTATLAIIAVLAALGLLGVVAVIYTQAEAAKSSVGQCASTIGPAFRNGSVSGCSTLR
jgi:hypothetical protein